MTCQSALRLSLINEESAQKNNVKWRCLSYNFVPWVRCSQVVTHFLTATVHVQARCVLCKRQLSSDKLHTIEEEREKEERDEDWQEVVYNYNYI